MVACPRLVLELVQQRALLIVIEVDVNVPAGRIVSGNNGEGSTWGMSASVLYPTELRAIHTSDA